MSEDELSKLVADSGDDPKKASLSALLAEEPKVAPKSATLATPKASEPTAEAKRIAELEAHIKKLEQQAVLAKAAKPIPTAELTEEQKRIRDLEHRAAVTQTQILDHIDDEDGPPAISDNRIAIHILIDGFTALGKVWRVGQELEFDVPSDAYDGTKDRYGKSWLEHTEADQMRLHGKIYFRRGPWPGAAWQDPLAAEKEKARQRAAPKMPAVLAGRAS